jgi:hypothetical protein
VARLETESLPALLNGERGALRSASAEEELHRRCFAEGGAAIRDGGGDVVSKLIAQRPGGPPLSKAAVPAVLLPLRQDEVLCLFSNTIQQASDSSFSAETFPSSPSAHCPPHSAHGTGGHATDAP